MNERWLPIAGYEGLYEVSDQGRVRRLVGHLCRVERFIGYVDGAGYIQAHLHKDGIGKQRRVHHLVLESFGPPRPEGTECAHHDGDRQNNRIGNLRWATSKENYQDAVRHGTNGCGERNGNARFTNDNVRYIRRSPESQRHLAKRFGASKTAIGRIRRRETWRHVI